MTTEREREANDNNRLSFEFKTDLTISPKSPASNSKESVNSTKTDNNDSSTTEVLGNNQQGCPLTQSTETSATEATYSGGIRATDQLLYLASLLDFQVSFDYSLGITMESF